MFLWPISIRFDYRRQGRVYIGRDEKTKASLAPHFNRPMSEWIRRLLEVQLPDFTQAELSEFDLEGVDNEIRNIAARFHPSPPMIDCEALLEPVPSLRDLDPQKSPRFFHSAVIGYFRWQNESILADLESLRGQVDCPGLGGDILSGRELPKPPPAEPPSEEDRFLVYDADFSQEKVVWQSRTQPGVVIHGPPGTGKSQTIVNIIADALAHNRTVLMVCQKQAATRVVFEKLKAVGLEDLCVEVHDAAANRQEVFKRIREQVDRLKGCEPKKLESRAQLSSQIVEKERLLDDHARALHEKHPRIGLSFRDLKAREGRLLAGFPTVRELSSLHKTLESLSAQKVNELGPRVRRIGQLFQQADPQNNPWRNRQITVMATPGTRADVAAVVLELRLCDDEYVRQVQGQGAGASLPIDVADFVPVAFQLLTQLQNLRSFSPNQRALVLRNMVPCWSRIISICDDAQMVNHENQCQNAIELALRVAKTSLDPQWNAVSADLPVKKLKKLRRSALKAFNHRERFWSFLIRFYRVSRAIRRARSNAAAEDRWGAFRGLIAHIDAKLEREQLKVVNAGLVPGSQPKGLNEKYQVIRPLMALRALEIAQLDCRHGERHIWIKQLTDAVSRDPTSLEPTLDKLERSIAQATLARKLLEALSDLEPFLTSEGLKEPRSNVRSGKSILDWVERLVSGFDKLDRLIALDADRQQREGHIRAVLDCLENYEARRANGERLPAPPDRLNLESYGEWWWALVEYTAVLVWQRVIYTQHPVLLQITSDVHQKIREELGDLLERKRLLEAPTIRERWLDRQLQYKDRPWPKLFQQRSSKQNKAPRLREAVATSLPNGLLAMRPCWLVNPEAAAQIFPLECGLFDVVIFDEASQCPIEQAVPAIYRGKSLIVAGDEKQLPPTDFFAAGRDGDGPEEEFEEEATREAVRTQVRSLQELGAQFLLQVEDLLEAAVGNLPPQWLKIHYRSVHPDLIAFSNWAFYRGLLEAPPSRHSSESAYRAIAYHDVGGVYDRRTNPQEATKVVQLLKDFWAQEGLAPTIGVVTFNQPQRELIEDVIDEECQRDEAFAAWYEREKNRKEDNQDVGFFVKNLENVQGDERDVMIFSTTFGRDSSGQFYRRFGPVGAKGGERRLNVAVTRAKKQVIVVGSMPLDDISDALQAGGVPATGITPSGYLQLYLTYARAVSEGKTERRDQILELLKRQTAPPQSEGAPESPLEQEVRQVLEKRGYTVKSQIGESGFRIDLAVLHPEPGRGYVLGIECDGATYHSDRSARIRDVWREKILRKRGWRIHRIWSTSWWYRRADEIEKLCQALEAALEEFESQPPATGQEELKETVNPCQPSTELSDKIRPCAPVYPSPVSSDPDEDKTLEALYRETNLSWDKLIAKYGLSRPVDRKMTLRQARMPKKAD